LSTSNALDFVAGHRLQTCHSSSISGPPSVAGTREVADWLQIPAQANLHSANINY
jgi:hypothetical protein